MNKDNLNLLMKTWHSLSTKDKSIRDLFKTEDYFLGDEVFDLQEFILTYIGVPEDNSHKIKYSEDGWFCRDWHHDQFWNCQEGKLSVDELIELLIEEYEAFNKKG